MKALQISGHGGSEVMIINEAVVAPVAAAGQVLVAVHAASVNPFDIKVRDGAVREMAELEFPAILGGDVAGIVAAIGEEVEGFAVGQEVYGVAGALSSHGSMAELVAVSATQLAAKPESIDFVTAAALPMAAASAYQALVDHMQLLAGQKILIHGGSGGIGSLAIQIAKHIGVYVATTARSSSADFVKGLGADEVIDYESVDFCELVHDYDAVLDTVGGETNNKSYTVLKTGGTLVSMVEQPDKERATALNITVISQFTQATTDRLEKITQLVDAGLLVTHVDKVFELDQAAEAFELLANGHPKGKVVIKIA